MTQNHSNQFLRRASAFAATLLACVSSTFLASGAAAWGQDDGSAKMRVIKPFIGYSDTYQWNDIPEIRAEGVKDANADQNLDFSWADDLFFEKEVWQLQFRYKNMRTIDVDFPAPDGKSLETKRVWYMVYSVTNTGERLRPAIDEKLNDELRANVKGDEDVNVSVSQRVIVPVEGSDESTVKVYEFPRNNLKGVPIPEKVVYDEKSESGAINFVPRFVFASNSIKDRIVYERKGDYFVGSNKGSEEAIYYDQFLPIAFAKIVQRERRGDMEFYDSVRMSNREIKPGETVWGIAMWTDVDVRIDKFSVYVSGLTNALHWDVTEDSGSKTFGDQRDIKRKALKINFFSPGDEERRGGKEIYNNLPGELDYEWIYM